MLAFWQEDLLASACSACELHAALSGIGFACRLIYVPVFLLLLSVAHASTARVLVKLALQDLRRPATAKPPVDDLEKACKVLPCTGEAEGALSPAPKMSSSLEMLDTAMSLAQEDNQ